ncbi:MAG TPA: preprotein translocase subunit YajC [Alphaproteobacteria bacterium]|nr:preprotein translocase subunit YajC [Alphaproteobacteria bacterium]
MQSGTDLMAFLPLIMVFAIFYFLMIRPQQKKAKEHQNKLGLLKKGDTVLLTSGIMGTVSKLSSDKEIQVEIAENVKVRVVRAMISDVVQSNGVLMDNVAKLNPNA